MLQDTLSSEPDLELGALRVQTPGLEAQDAFIQDLLSIVTTLRRKRNSLVTACNLPSELLSRVFEYDQLIEGWPELNTVDGTRKYTPGWITVAHVCERWREVRRNHQ